MTVANSGAALLAVDAIATSSAVTSGASAQYCAFDLELAIEEDNRDGRAASRAGLSAPACAPTSGPIAAMTTYQAAAPKAGNELLAAASAAASCAMFPALSSDARCAQPQAVGKRAFLLSRRHARLTGLARTAVLALGPTAYAVAADQWTSARTIGISSPAPTACQAAYLGALALGVFCRREHPLAQAGCEPNLEDLLSHGFVVTEREQEAAWWPLEFRRKIVLQAPSLATAKRLCCDRDLLCVLPEVCDTTRRVGKSSLVRLALPISLKVAKVYALTRRHLDPEGRAAAIVKAVTRALDGVQRKEH